MEPEILIYTSSGNAVSTRLKQNHVIDEDENDDAHVSRY